MYRCLVLSENSLLAKAYVQKMESVFSNLPQRTYEKATHIAVFTGEEIVGGVTLESFASLAEDLDVVRLWRTNSTGPATRILRFWTSRQALVPMLFEAIMTAVSRETYLYGILSVPVDAAKKYSDLMTEHQYLLEPLLPAEQEQVSETQPSSEGKRLLSAYLKVGASFLGPAAMCLEDKSVKIVMGTSASRVALFKTGERYETASV